MTDHSCCLVPVFRVSSVGLVQGGGKVSRWVRTNCGSGLLFGFHVKNFVPVSFCVFRDVKGNRVCQACSDRTGQRSVCSFDLGSCFRWTQEQFDTDPGSEDTSVKGKLNCFSVPCRALREIRAPKGPPRAGTSHTSVGSRRSAF